MRRHIATAVAFACIAPLAFPCSTRALSSELDHYRERMLFDFAASKQLVSFPVVLAPNTSGLLLVDKTNDEKKIIYEDAVVMHSPYLSIDGNRLIFVQRKTPQDDQQLIACTIANWHCDIVLTVMGTIFSPIEVAPDTILYSSSPLVGVGSRKRAARHNLFILKRGSVPVQLTNFDAYQLSALSVSGRRIIFSMFGNNGEKGLFVTPSSPIMVSSDIYSGQLGDSLSEIVFPERPAVPLFVMKELSTNASIAADGNHLAFLNRRNSAGQTHFNLAIADGGKVIGYVYARKFGFSRPIFVDQTVVANELLEDRYEVSEFTVSGQRSPAHVVVDHSIAALKALPRIKLTVSAAPNVAQ